MAMLAAPRRKQKVINLRAKNNAWSNDSNKFGQRMLEKMGWSSGKGLGAKENGIVEHVVAKYKNDDRGLGFEDKNDQWTKHEDDFNALLANLSNADGTEEKLHSGVSLETKSKKSKARVHYHKYTRGKDLTRYSEKDLANIFGKKSLKEQEKVEQPVQDDIKASEQVFTEKGSMEDYFKSKLAKFKSKSNLMLPKNESYDNAEYAFKGFSTNTDENDDDNNQIHQGFGFSFYNSSPITETEKENGNINEISEDVEGTKKAKKKKKKNKDKDLLQEIQTESMPSEVTEAMESCEINLEPESNLKSEKKSKKKKKSNEESCVSQSDEPEEIKPKKKKSKINNNTESVEEPTPAKQEEDQNNYVPKKKKKRKNKDNE